MTFLGKILTVVIFIMSILFMGFSMAVYNTQVVWRDVVKGTDEKPGGLEAQKEEADQEIGRLEDDMEELRQSFAHENAARKMAVAYWQERANIAESQLREKEATLAQLTIALGEATGTLESTHVALAGITEEIGVLRGNLRLALKDRDDKFHLAVALQDRLHQAEGMRRRLEERRIQLVEQVARQMRVLEHHGMTQWDPIPDRPPRGLDGVLTAVNDEQELVEISLGSDDGLRVGHEMEVSRGRQYLGRVIIRRTWDDHAVGEIIPERLQGPMQPGDKVVTKVT